MKNRHLNSIGWIGLFLLTTMLSSCMVLDRTDRFISQAIHPEQLITDLRPDIETLYLSWHELDQIYHDIKFLERAFLFDPDDRQLGYIQKAGLYVQDASVRIHHLWERLSVLHFIRPEMMRDYLTLSVKGLTLAIDEIGYDEMFLKLHQPYITHSAITGDVNRALDSIKKNQALLNQMLERLIPLANPTAPPLPL